ncbi:hypothetical protein SAMN06272727_3319 [Streptomyces sp. Ag82_G6-1]|nr:hypothetical protein SAMN06272727_3319 [Streptomyces sp. Ag82_G6-1]
MTLNEELQSGLLILARGCGHFKTFSVDFENDCPCLLPLQPRRDDGCSLPKGERGSGERQADKAESHGRLWRSRTGVLSRGVCGVHPEKTTNFK